MSYEMVSWKQLIKDQLCPGHERAMPVERTVMEIDVTEEDKCPLLMHVKVKVVGLRSRKCFHGNN